MAIKQVNVGGTTHDIELLGADRINGFLSSGKILSTYLPSYVDDVLEYDTKANFPATGETGKIYVDKATNQVYRWSGS
jgi:hypothetical protein